MNNSENRNEKEKYEKIEKKNALAHGSSRLDPAIHLVDRALEIEKADSSIRSHAGGKLDVIARQIRSLQKEASEILEQAEKDAALHRVECAFEKRIEEIIHLYRRSDNSMYFSKLSPEEWGTPPHEFLGSYRLKADRSFEEVN